MELNLTIFKFLAVSNVPALLTTYGYFIYLLLAIIEGPIVTIIAAFLSSLGYLNVFLIYGLAIAANLIGDIIYYGLGRWGSKRVAAHGRFLGINIEESKKLEKHFEQHSGKTLFLAKWTHFAGVPVLMAGGMSKMSFKKFIWFNFLGELPKSLVFVLIGYYFGQAYRQIDRYLIYGSFVAAFIIIIVIVVYLLKKKYKKEIE